MSELSPMLIFQTLQAHANTQALKSAIELHLFTEIAAGHKTPAALVTACKASEKGIRVLCDTMTILGFLTKSGTEYALTPDSAMFLDMKSRAYLGGCVKFLSGESQSKGFELLTDAVRQGGTAASAEGSMAPENPAWVDFARGMMPMMMPAAEAIASILAVAQAGPQKVLDIAAGHGLFGITIARHNPQAQIYALDWKAVLAVAEEHAGQFGVAERYHKIEGSAFDVDFGVGYDIALVTNFLHHFDFETNVRLMEKVRKCLSPAGRAVILEFVPDDTRLSPPGAGLFALTMLASTRAGDAYTFAELEAMCRAAGYGAVSIHPVGPTPQSIVVASV